MQYILPRAALCALALLVLIPAISTFAEDAASTPPLRIPSIGELKTLYPNTVLVEGGRPQAIIVAPDDKYYQQLAVCVRNAIQTTSGVSLDIHNDAEFAGRYGHLIKRPEQNVILIGNLGASSLVAYLYAWKRCCVDAGYPGKDGYVIQTIQDPWGNGKNIILLGGSDRDGIAWAADEFCATLPKGDTLKITGPSRLALSEAFVKRFPDFGKELSDAEIAQKVQEADKAFRAGVHGGLFPQITSAASLYTRSGKEGYAKLFRALIFLADDLYRQNLGTYGGPWGMDADFQFADLIALWDGLEESPSLSVEDRLRITNIILDYIHYWESYWSISPVFNPDIRSNHTTFTSLGFYFASDYFGKYYKFPKADDWRKIAEGCFGSQGKSFKPQEDSNSYQWITLAHMMRYALASPDKYYLTSGNARIGGDLAIMTMDNLGYQVSFGDVGGFHGGNQEMMLLRSLTAMERDGRYAWAYKKGCEVRPGQGFGSYATDVEPAEPTDLLGVKSLHTDLMFYKHHNGTGTVPQEKTFEKVTFRTSFDAQEPYLILDGISACGHGHYDGNSILRLTDRGRIWLADCDYIKSQPKFHNMMMVFRDGQSFGLPTFSELDLAVELDTVGLSRTTTPGCSGTDWTRNIIWDKGHTFVVVDEVEAKVADEFSLRCNWHTLGKTELKGDTFKSTQGGPSFTVKNLDGAAQRTWDDATIGKNWSTYKFAEPIVRTLQQVHTVRLSAGDKVYFLNVLNTQDKGRAPVKAERISDSAILLGSGKDLSVVGVGTGDEVIPGVKTDARIYRISKTSIALGNATHLYVRGHSMFTSRSPVSVELSANGITVVAAKSTMISVQGKASNLLLDGKPATGQQSGPVVSIEIPEGRHRLEGTALPSTFDVQFPKPTPAKTQSRSASDQGVKSLSVAAQVTGKSLVSMAASADGGLYAGDSNGRVYSLSADGTVRWEFDAGSLVRAIWTGRLDKDTAPYIAVGTAESMVYLLDESGKMLWKQELPYYKRTASVVYFSSADLAGDGNRTLIVGSENWHHYAFDSKGNKIWQYESIHASTAGTAVDLDGDGRQEYIAGTEYYWWHGVSADGVKLWQYRAPSGPRTTSVVAADVTGEKKPTVLFGGADGNIHAVDTLGAGKWLFNTGDEITGLALADLNGDGIPEAVASSLSFNVNAVKGDGTRLWRRDLGEPVLALALADVDGDGAPEICVGTENGRVLALGKDGDTLATWSAKSTVKKLSAIPGEPDRLAVISADGGLTVLGMAE